ncbi:MAG: [ribosomal protein S18]-alanine N-acetyltransferase [Acidobacteriota bacterium]|jgi:ribosomal-protein-alanine N-acetyltransferase|nr:[ribosomal protein S18]-alanine N-acetyltransferase [Acidobacteriota bacterium]
MVSTIREAQEFYLARMTEHDLLDVVALEETCGLSRWGWEAYHAELAQERNSIMLVARVGNEGDPSTDQKVKGFIAARLVADELHVNNVAVKHEYRRLGIAKKLLETTLDEAARMGAQIGFLEVRAGNVPAQALYARCGFRVTGRRPGYYTQPVEDALVMSLAIRSSA